MTRQAEDLRTCPACNREIENAEMVWTYDRYGIPWQKVCPRCEERTKREILAFVFDPTFAGESLEAEEY